jgi:hypothetical protein
VTATERDEEELREGQSGPIHGGNEDPLGGGVADLEESPEITEGVPEQDPKEEEA